MEKHVGQSSALQEIDRWSSCKFSTAGKHSVQLLRENYFQGGDKYPHVLLATIVM